MPRKPATQIWRERLAPFESSGLSIGDFCRRIGISERQFYYWRPRTESASSAGPSSHPPRKAAPPGFVRLVPETEEAADSGLSVFVGSARIGVARGFDALLLRQVVRALEQAGEC